MAGAARKREDVACERAWRLWKMAEVTATNGLGNIGWGDDGSDSLECWSSRWAWRSRVEERKSVKAATTARRGGDDGN